MRLLVQAPSVLCAGILASGCAKTQVSSPASAPAAAEPTTDTIRATIQNDCPRPVNVTFGNEPPGRHAEATRLPAGSKQTRLLEPGERLWLLRDDGSWAAGASIEEDGGQITILATCSAVGTIEAD
jgi:hypothetical protein